MVKTVADEDENLTPGQIADREASKRALRGLAEPKQAYVPSVTMTPDTVKKYKQRTEAEWREIVSSVDAKRAKGDTQGAACESHGIATSQYVKYKKKFSGVKTTVLKVPTVVLKPVADPKTAMLSAFDAAVDSEVEKRLTLRLKESLRERMLKLVETLHDILNTAVDEVEAM